MFSLHFVDELIFYFKDTLWIAKFKNWAQLQCLCNDRSTVQWWLGPFVSHRRVCLSQATTAIMTYRIWHGVCQGLWTDSSLTQAWPRRRRSLCAERRQDLWCAGVPGSRPLVTLPQCSLCQRGFGVNRGAEPWLQHSRSGHCWHPSPLCRTLKHINSI